MSNYMVITAINGGKKPLFHSILVEMAISGEGGARKKEHPFSVLLFSGK